MDAEARRQELVALYKEASVCVRCPLSTTRTKVVFGAGNADADLMFVGEGPGAEEDRQGIPFVGRAGKLLDELLGEMGIARDDVFIANVVKCRCPGNRDPMPLEIESCRPYLFRQIELIEPRVLCTLGNFATKLLTGNPTGISRVHGTPQVHRLGERTVYVMPLYHPAAALRTPSLVEDLRRDLAQVRGLLEQPAPEDFEAGTPPAVPEAQAEREQLGLFGTPSA